MPTAVLDAYGRPATQQVASSALYSRTEADARLRPPPPNHFDDYAALLNPWVWRRLVSESRAIASRGQVAAALFQKADYVSGSQWRPFFAGEDSAWGEQAEELLAETESAVCTRGPRYDWRTLWHLGVPTAAADGSYFLLLTGLSDPVWPLLQPIEAHRIGQRGSETTVKAGSAITQIKNQDDPNAGPIEISTPYDGLRIQNGIITNRQGMEVAYRVLGPTPDQDQDVSARDMIHIGAPRWFSELRPLPEIAPALLDLMGVDVARTSQLDQQIIDSKITVLEGTATGKQDPVRNAINPPMAYPTHAGASAPEMIERAQFRYYKAGGPEPKPWQAQRPSDQWMNYDERMSASALAAIRWRLEMLDPSKLSGNATRALQDQINTLILSCFQIFAPAAIRSVRYMISKHITAGRLPENPEFMKWGITPPPELVLDRNAMRFEIEGVRAGVQSMPDLQRRMGLRSRQVLVSQAKYEQQKDAIAKQYGIVPERLGTLSIPGDVLAKPGATDPENPQSNAV